MLVDDVTSWLQLVCDIFCSQQKHTNSVWNVNGNTCKAFDCKEFISIGINDLHCFVIFQPSFDRLLSIRGKPARRARRSTLTPPPPSTPRPSYSSTPARGAARGCIIARGDVYVAVSGGNAGRRRQWRRHQQSPPSTSQPSPSPPPSPPPSESLLLLLLLPPPPPPPPLGSVSVSVAAATATPVVVARGSRPWPTGAQW